MDLPSITNRKIISLLKKHRFTHIRKTRHGYFYKAVVRGEDRLVMVPNPPHKTCPKGIVEQLVRNSGLSEEEFFNPKLLKKKK